jgi:hypothetical protein
MIDYDNLKEERWCEECRNQGAGYLHRENVAHREIGND